MIFVIRYRWKGDKTSSANKVGWYREARKLSGDGSGCLAGIASVAKE